MPSFDTIALTIIAMIAAREAFHYLRNRQDMSRRAMIRDHH